MLKSNKGITLVALVITIIVLLILAGVSISLVVGDNGVLTQAQNAATETDLSSANQAMQLAITSVNTDFLATVWTNDVNAVISSWAASKLGTVLANSGYVMTVPASGNFSDGMTVTIHQDGKTTSYTYTLTFNGENNQLLLTKANTPTHADGQE